MEVISATGTLSFVFATLAHICYLKRYRNLQESDVENLEYLIRKHIPLGNEDHMDVRVTKCDLKTGRCVFIIFIITGISLFRKIYMLFL
jgi:hypothetical protein